MLAQTLVALNGTMKMMMQEGAETLLSAWLARSPSAHGARIEWDGPAGPLQGTTAGLASDGALLMQTSDDLVRIRSGEVRWM